MFKLPEQPFSSQMSTFVVFVQCDVELFSLRQNFASIGSGVFPRILPSGQP